MPRIVLLDGYIDEPSCLGVPPYISPQVRYIYGALLLSGYHEEEIEYLTADQIRVPDKGVVIPPCEWLLVVGGTTVPGRYLGGKPLTLKEMKLLSAAEAQKKWLLGPVVEAGFRPEGYDHYAGEELEHEVLKGEKCTLEFSLASMEKTAVLGAGLVRRHPQFPYVIMELETYRGCRRSSHCLFCSENFKKRKYTRKAEDIKNEVKTLYQEGALYFRLGSQPDLLSYSDGGKDPIKRLYTGIREAAPSLKVLHLDNIEPGGLIRNPEKKGALKTIVNYNTPGDIASFGMESADMEVIKRNNIATTPSECFSAIELINHYGGKRTDGIPRLLPGLNFLHGLLGETEETLRLNLEFLEEIKNAEFLLRRINVRQVISHGDYPGKKVKKGKFQEYKDRINQEFNRPMLKQVFPRGLVFPEVITEKVEGNLTFARPLGTYPVRIGLPGKLPLREALAVKIIDHGYRSLTGVRYPFNLNEASMEEIRALPGIGKKRASSLILKRPFESLSELCEILDPETLEVMRELVDKL